MIHAVPKTLFSLTMLLAWKYIRLVNICLRDMPAAPGTNSCPFSVSTYPLRCGKAISTSLQELKFYGRWKSLKVLRLIEPFSVSGYHELFLGWMRCWFLCYKLDRLINALTVNGNASHTEYLLSSFTRFTYASLRIPFSRNECKIYDILSGSLYVLFSIIFLAHSMTLWRGRVYASTSLHSSPRVEEPTMNYYSSRALHGNCRGPAAQGTASRWSDASLLVFPSATPAGGQGMLL
jgi:hypothetical protein